MYQLYIKRGIDAVLSFVAIVLLCPALALIALWVKLDSKGPVFFCQKRVGQHKRLFMIIKFRTMRSDAPHEIPKDEMAGSEQYITRSGRFLRRFSLDELPQLLNILRGRMSIIGPRPALWNQTRLIALRDEYGVNDIKPGLSGWAQVNGRDELDDEEKALRDAEYAQNLTFRMDVKCFLLSIGKVFRGDGIAEGKERMHYQIRKVEDD